MNEQSNFMAIVSHNMMPYVTSHWGVDSLCGIMISLFIFIIVFLIVTFGIFFILQKCSSSPPVLVPIIISLIMLIICMPVFFSLEKNSGAFLYHHSNSFKEKYGAQQNKINQVLIETVSKCHKSFCVFDKSPTIPNAQFISGSSYVTTHLTFQFWVKILSVSLVPEGHNTPGGMYFFVKLSAHAMLNKDRYTGVYMIPAFELLSQLNPNAQLGSYPDVPPPPPPSVEEKTKLLKAKFENSVSD